MDKLQELMNRLEDLKVQAGKLTKAEEINAKIEEIKDLKAQIVLEEMKIADEKEVAKNKIKEGKMSDITSNKGDKEDIYNGELFTIAIANSILAQRGLPIKSLTTEQQNAITEKVGEDGGYAVPEDISVKINKRLKEKTDVSTLADSEKVYTRKGQRTYEKRADQTPLANLDEGETIPGTDNAKLERLTFNLHDFAGMITIPNDLLQFGTSELQGYLIDWLVDKVRFTRNTKILYGTGEGSDVQGIIKSKEYTSYPLEATAGIKDFKKMKNVNLMNVFKASAKWIVNQDGFNYLDSLEDKNGRPYLQTDPKNTTEYKFLGLSVIELPNTVLKTTEAEIPIILGDVKEAYKYFYDNKYQLLTTNIGAGAFETNTTKTRVIMKLDGTVKDKDGIIIIKLAKTAE